MLHDLGRKNDYLVIFCTIIAIFARKSEAWGTDVLVLTEEQKAELKVLADKLIG